MENKLTTESIKEMVKNFEADFGGYKIEMIENPMLKGTQVIIRSGDKAYYSPDIKSGEVTVITLPEEELLLSKPLKINFYVEENNSVANQGLEIYDSEKRAFDDINKAQPKEYTALVGKEWKEAVDQLRKSEEEKVANLNTFNAEEKYFDNDK